MNITTDIRPKRGRKKKIDIVQTTNSDTVTTDRTDSVTTDTTDSVTTDRTDSVTIDRTDSVTTDTTDSAIMVKDSIDTITTETATSIPIEPPKKRGRKKKIVITEIVDDLKKIKISESEKNQVSFSEKNQVDTTINHSIYSRFLNLSITDRCYFYYSFQDVMKIEKYEKGKIYLLQFTFAYISFENDEYILPGSDILELRSDILELRSDNYLQYNNSKIYLNCINRINPIQFGKLKFKKIIIFYNMYPYTDWIDNSSLLLQTILQNNLSEDNCLLENRSIMKLKFNINGKTITFRELLQEM